MNAGGRTSRVRLVAERWPDAEGKPSSEAVVSRSAVRGTASSCVVAKRSQAATQASRRKGSSASTDALAEHGTTVSPRNRTVGVSQNRASPGGEPADHAARLEIGESRVSSDLGQETSRRAKAGSGEPSRRTRWLVHAAEDKRVFRTDRHDDGRVDEAADLAAEARSGCHVTPGSRPALVLARASG